MRGRGGVIPGIAAGRDPVFGSPVFGSPVFGSPVFGSGDQHDDLVAERCDQGGLRDRQDQFCG